MELQRRDLKILKFCLEQKFATLLQIGKMFYQESKNIYHRPAKRVCQLVNEGLLRAEHLGVCKKTLYLTTREGVRLLKEKQMDSGLGALKSIDIRTLEHDEMVTDVRIILDLLMGWADWKSERVLKQESGKRKVPDGTCQGRDQSYMIEVERTLKRKSYYEDVLFEACRRDDFSGYLIFYIMGNDADLKWLMNEAREWSDIMFATMKEMNEITQTLPFRNVDRGECGDDRSYQGGVHFSKNWDDPFASSRENFPEGANSKYYKRTKESDGHDLKAARKEDKRRRELEVEYEKLRAQGLTHREIHKLRMAENKEVV